MERYGSINSIRNNQIFIEKARLLSIDGEGRKKNKARMSYICKRFIIMMKLKNVTDRQTDFLTY